MLHGNMRRLLLAAALVAVAGVTAACESAAERQARLEREAYLESLDVEALKNSLKTVNPDPYADTGTGNIGRFRQN